MKNSKNKTVPTTTADQYIVVLFYGEKKSWEDDLGKIPKNATTLLFFLENENTDEINDCLEPLLKKEIAVKCVEYSKNIFSEIKEVSTSNVKNDITLKQDKGVDTKNYLHIILCTSLWKGLLNEFKLRLDGSYASIDLTQSLRGANLFTRRSTNQGISTTPDFMTQKGPSPEQKARAMYRKQQAERKRAKEEKANENTQETDAKEEAYSDSFEEEPSFYDEPVFEDDPFMDEPPDDFLGPEDDFIDDQEIQDLDKENKSEEINSKNEGYKENLSSSNEDIPKSQDSKWNGNSSTKNSQIHYEPPKDNKREKPQDRIIMPNINRPHKGKKPKEPVEKDEFQKVVNQSLITIRNKCMGNETPFFAVCGSGKNGYRIYATEDIPDKIVFTSVMGDEPPEVSSREDMLEQLLLVAHGYKATPSRVTELRDAKAYLINALQLRIQEHVNSLKKKTLFNDNTMHFITMINKTDDKDVFNDKWNSFLNKGGKTVSVFDNNEDFEAIKKEANYYVLLLKFLYSGDVGSKFKPHQNSEEEKKGVK